MQAARHGGFWAWEPEAGNFTRRSLFEQSRAMELKPEHRRFLTRLALLVFGLWIGLPLLIYGCASSSTERAGQIGDIFGAINALFSGIALIGIVGALILQQEELSLSTKELRNSAKALRKQVELAADTARLQSLPTLIASTKLRIKTVGHTDFENFDKVEFTHEQLVDLVANLEQLVRTLPADIERSKQLLANIEGQRYSPVNDPRAEMRSDIRDMEAICAGSAQVLPLLKILISYMADLTTLYQRMASARIDAE
jgi:hypothetical protein